MPLSYASLAVRSLVVIHNVGDVSCCYVGGYGLHIAHRRGDAWSEGQNMGWPQQHSAEPNLCRSKGLGLPAARRYASKPPAWSPFLAHPLPI